MFKAVILNDTRGDNHFGCFRVMRVIEEQLARRNIKVIATSLVRNDWENDRRFLAAMPQADVIVINGEGTLHHGAKAGERLLKVVDHPVRGEKPVVLINALYQENPTDWNGYLEKMALIATRDSWSAKSVLEQTGREVFMVPDLSLAEGMMPPSPHTRDLLLVGDSVSRETSRGLLRIAASRPDARLFPITLTIKASKPHFPQPLKAMRDAYTKLHAAGFALRHGNVLFNKTEDDFVDDLRRASLHVTGRFHSICFCLFTRTPFLALDSNSWKIEALLHDLDLGTSRIVKLQDIEARMANVENEALTVEEEQKIATALELCKRKAGQLFDEIRRIAEGK